MANSETVLHFGKYKGKTVAEVRAENPGYLIWAHENVGTFALANPLIKPIFDEALTVSYRRGAARASAKAARAIMRTPVCLPTDMATDDDAGETDFGYEERPNDGWPEMADYHDSDSR